MNQPGLAPNRTDRTIFDSLYLKTLNIYIIYLHIDAHFLQT